MIGLLFLTGCALMQDLTLRSRLEALETQQKHLEKIIGVLERFNGVPFVTVGEAANAAYWRRAA